MIVSASRRTDIPCFYAEWMMNRFRAGYALARNPMNHAQLARVPLTPDVVDCVVFWTKDAANLLPRLGELDERGYAYYFQFTLTPYDRALEPNLRGKAEIAATFRALSKRIGSRAAPRSGRGRYSLRARAHTGAGRRPRSRPRRGDRAPAPSRQKSRPARRVQPGERRGSGRFSASDTGRQS